MNETKLLTRTLRGGVVVALSAILTVGLTLGATLAQDATTRTETDETVADETAPAPAADAASGSGAMGPMMAAPGSAEPADGIAAKDPGSKCVEFPEMCGNAQ